MPPHTAERPADTVTAPREAPLSAAKRAMIALGIAAVLLIAYLFCALSLLLVATLLILDAVLVIPALRIGMAGYFATATMKQGILAGYLVKALRLRETAELSVPLDRSEAPQLFEMLDRLAVDIAVPPPAEVRLMMQMNAWVRVRGYRSARTGSIVGIGLDMLAACTVDQVRGVLAHELAHAKLIQPGFNGWLKNAMRRIAQLAATVGGLEQGFRSQDESFYTAALIHKGLSFLGRSGSRLVALHSRQHEFAADAVAAKVAGVAPFRDGLLRVHVAEQAASDVDHRERLIQSEKEESFTAWLQSKMIATPEDEAKFTEKALAGGDLDPYDSHPSLADRIRALPEPDAPAPESPIATCLLANADATSSRLLCELERVFSEEEKKENVELLRDVRKNTPRPSITGLQGLIFLIQLILAVIFVFFLIFWIAEFKLQDAFAGAVVLLLLVAAMAGFGALYRLTRRKEKCFLPSPAYALLGQRLENGPLCATPQQAAQWRSEAVAAYPAIHPPGLRGRRAISNWFGDRCFEALGQADYRAAYAFACHGLALNRHNLKAMLTTPIVAAAVGNDNEATATLNEVFGRHPLGPSVSWCAGWTYALMGEWPTSEAYLHDAATRRPGDPSVWALLAYCQWQRDKIRESVNSMRRAIDLRPDDASQQLLLARVLLDAGRPREAEQILTHLSGDVAASREALLAQVRLSLLLGRIPEAEAVVEQITTRHASGKVWLDIGRAYYEAKKTDAAVAALARVPEFGHYPEAIGLRAIILHEIGDKETWRPLMLSALNMARPAAEGAVTPHQMLKVACRSLMMGREPVMCRAWVATLRVGGLGFASDGLLLVVLAPDSDAAGAIVQELWTAMHGGLPPAAPPVKWQALPQESQPDEAVPPGIYEVQLTEVANHGWMNMVKAG